MTDKTPAMPELPEPDYWSTRDDDTPLYTADQMRAYALAALQSAQPAEVSDAAVDLVGNELARKHAVYLSRETVQDLLARAILALRPQATSDEPFGYFRAQPFGWEQCAETDEGAKALYERPQAASRDFDQWFAGRYPDATGKFSEFRATPVRDLMRAAYQSAAQQAVPMTLEQMRTLMAECGYDHASLQERADFISGVRAGERWHGITAQGAGEV